MRKTIFVVSAISICVFISNAFCEENKPAPVLDANTVQSSDTCETRREKSDSDFWQKLWGKKARNAILLGMWSIHVDGTGEYFGDGRNNDQNHLVGLQYYGLSAGTFINSKDDRAYYFGPAREVYSHNFTDDTRFDIGYKFGLLYGYGDDLINVGGMSIYAIATFGISWKRLGFDLGMVPAGIITGNFRFDIDF